jgi:hypothetical protein
MEPDLPQHDLIAAFVNARQYSFANFLTHREKFAARFKSFANFFIPKILLEVEECMSCFPV